jgi:hypothetical protein
MAIKREFLNEIITWAINGAEMEKVSTQNQENEKKTLKLLLLKKHATCFNVTEIPSNR